ncbi:MAG: PTS IIA-like nitrogen regulatory protein PtsN [Alphaproteobacteria bacterium]|nr:PTS IIA-like nitrogen regulatory protein PtsN [Alphaproteobacteria bacterium]
MEVSELLTVESVIADLRVTSKKQALQELSKFAADQTGQDERAIFDILLERERLGTTGVGDGLAIPHGRMQGLEKIQGFFARLEKPLDFDSIDDRPVDLIFLLLAPEGAGADHLKALARISRLLRGPAICEKLRGATNRDALFALLSQVPEANPNLRAAS